METYDSISDIIIHVLKTSGLEWFKEKTEVGLLPNQFWFSMCTQPKIEDFTIRSELTNDFFEKVLLAYFQNKTKQKVLVCVENRSLYLAKRFACWF